MPSALENLIKILKLEQSNQFNNKAVIGGMQAYAPNWAAQAHQEARLPEQHALVEELLLVMGDYDLCTTSEQRHDLAKYMFERITRRTDARPQYQGAVQASPSPEDAPEAPDPEIAAAVESNPALKDGSFLEALPDLDESQPSMPAPPTPDTPRPSLAPKPLLRRREEPSTTEAQATLKALAAPITTIKGIGEAMADKFGSLGVESLRDLLYFFPRRYDDYTRLLPIAKLRPFEQITLIATVRGIHERVSKGGLKMLVVKVDDSTATMDITFFNQVWLKRQIKPGMQLVFRGKTDIYLGRVTLNNPEWEPVDQQSLRSGEIVPVYPLTKGITSRTMRRMMKQVVSEWAARMPDHLPQSVLERTELVQLGWALRQMHLPEKREYIGYARERLAFDEMIALQLGMLGNRYEWQSTPAYPLQLPEGWLSEFQAGLPFALTNAQRRAITEIGADLAQPVPMNRLLQGDVGAGKTMVAAVTLATAMLNGYQAALMAPTSILAEQHFQKLGELFAATPGLEQKRIELLTSSLSSRARQNLYEEIASGAVDLVIGTHAVIQEGVEFPRLAAAVIDEQHRFGVEQRGALRGKGINPHLLVMSATPIPRTLALTVHADLDLSILDEMPPGRTPIQTRVITPAQRTRAYEFIEEMVLKQGQQVYVIYPLVEASDSINAASAVEGFEYLKKVVFRNYRVGLMHGRLRADEKEFVMRMFSEGKTQVLVSTSVIEVGVDVPNATAMIIEGAERFGLAQLHQFRGRVGRGDQKSYCILISEEESERLMIMQQTTDGFEIAQKDWELRGAGDLLGLRQSGGGGQLDTLELVDSRLVALAQQEARTLYAEDPLLQLPEHTLLAGRVQQTMDERSDIS